MDHTAANDQIGRSSRRERRALLICIGIGISALAGGCGGGTPVAGEPIRVTRILGELGDAPGRFAYPRVLEPDGDKLWVIDKAARVQRLDSRTGWCETWFRMPEFELGKPVGMAIGPAPDLGVGAGVPPGEPVLYIADTHYSRVQVYARPPATPAGATTSTPWEAAPLATFGSYGQEPGQFIYTTDIAVLPTADGKGVDRIYVGEYGGNDRVSVFDASLKFQFSFGSYGDSSSAESIQFDRPQSLRIDPATRTLLVVDSRNHRIGRFTLEGALVSWLKDTTAADGRPEPLNYPYDLCLLKDGTAMVAEYGGNRVRRIDLATGRSLGEWGRAGHGVGELVNPWAVCLIDRTAFVLDSGNNRVQAFESPAAPAAGLASATGGAR